MVLAQITCIMKSRTGCPGSVPKGRARQEDGKMSQEVGVSALGIATADRASGHVLVQCKPGPLTLCVSMNYHHWIWETKLLQHQETLSLHSHVYPALPYAKCNVLSGIFFIFFHSIYWWCMGTSRESAFGGLGSGGKGFPDLWVENSGLEVEILSEIPPPYIGGQPRQTWFLSPFYGICSWSLWMCALAEKLLL